MALLDSIFNPASYNGGMSNGLLGYLAQALREKSGAITDETQPVPVVGGAGNYAVPTFGQPPQANIPQAAQPAQYQPQYQPPPSLPSAVLGGPGNNLMAGFQGFTNSGSPMQAIGNLVGGLVTGERTDPQGIALAQMNATYQALVPQLGPRTAAVLAMNPAALGELLKPNVVPLGGHTESTLSLPGIGPSQSTNNDSTLAQLGYTPDVLKAMANRFWQGDKTVAQSLPRGNAGLLVSGALQKAINDYGVANNKSTEDLSRSQANFKNITDTIGAFGGAGKQGQQVRSFSTAIDHLTLARNLSQAMQNGDVRAVNSLRAEWSKQFGSPLPTNVDAVKQIVSAEVSKAVQGSDIAKEDREHLQEPLGTANSWPQISGVIDNVYQPLMVGQLRNLRNQYLVNSGDLPENFDKKLSPEAKRVMQTVSPTGAPQGGIGGKTKSGISWNVIH